MSQPHPPEERGARPAVPAPASSRTLPPLPARTLLVLLGVFLAALLAYLRLPATTRRTVWAEDGQVFLHDYLLSGPGLLEPYDGYLHLLPRLAVAVLVPVWGVEHYAAAVTVTSCLLLGVVCVLTYYCTAALSTVPWIRMCWASIPLLVAPGALETLGNLANLHWYLLWLLPLLLIREPSSLAGRILLLTATLAATLTEIQALLFAPLILYRLTNRALWWSKGGLLLGLSFQLGALALSPRIRDGMGEDWNLLSVFYGWVLNSAGAVAYGSSEVISSHILSFGSIPIILSAVPYVAALAVVYARANRLPRLMAGTWFLGSAAVWSAAVIINPVAYFDYAAYGAQDWRAFFLSRYSTLPSMYLLALVPLMMSVLVGQRHPENRSRARGRTVAMVVAGIFLTLQLVYYFPVDAARSQGPEWTTGVDEARLLCSGQPLREMVEVPVAPSGWAAAIPCDRLAAPAP